MRFRKVTAIIRRDVLDGVETRLREIGVPAITVTQAKGYGEYKNFFTDDWKVGAARIEIFTTCDEAEAIALAIAEAAHSGLRGDGIVAVLPVEQLYDIRSLSPATEEHICCCPESSPHTT